MTVVLLLIKLYRSLLLIKIITTTSVGNNIDGDGDDYVDDNANNTNRVGIKLRQHIGNCDYNNSMGENNNSMGENNYCIVDAVVI